MTKKRAAACSSGDEDDEISRRLQSCTDETSAFLNGEVATTLTGQSADDKVLKLCQVRLYDLLQGYLDKNLEIHSDDPGPSAEAEEVDVQEEQGFQLFRTAPPGITLEQPTIEQVPVNGTGQKAKPRPHSLRKWKLGSFDTKSALESVVVDGDFITAESRRAVDKALEKWRVNLLKKATVLAAEERRVAELKEQRGEKWLPSFVRDNPTAKTRRKKKKSKSIDASPLL